MGFFLFEETFSFPTFLGSWTSCDMAGTLDGVVEKFLYPHRLKIPRVALLFAGRPREFAKPRSTNLRNARDEWLCMFLLFNNDALIAERERGAEEHQTVIIK